MKNIESKMSTCKIHNIRFYNLKPRAISCICYEKSSKKLALSRDAGKDEEKFIASIEIWNVAHSIFVEEATYYPDHSIEAMIWINKNRLLTTGLSGSIVEFDLNLKVKNETTVTGGAAWCFDINPEKTKLAVGTEEGYINIFSISDDSLIYERIFDKQKGRILCLKWNNTGDMLYTGSSDTIRVWNFSSGHAIHKMTTSRKQIKKETVVWCLGVTNDNHIVSGDSRGVLSIWDPISGTLIESHETHTGDILALAICQNENIIYCAGVDPVIRSYSKYFKSTSSTTVNKVTPRWVKGIERRVHTHEVRALIDVDGKLYSAGVDGYLAQSSYPPKTLSKYPPLLPSKSVIVCPKSRCVVLRHVDYFELWKLGVPTKDTVSPGMFHSLETGPMKLLELHTSSDESITSFAVSNNSKIIVYSTRNHMRVFNFEVVDGEAQLLRNNETDKLLNNVNQMLFSPNNKLFVALTNDHDGSKISVFSVAKKRLNPTGFFYTAKHKLENISLLCFSPDNKYLACSSRDGRIVIYIVDEKFSTESPDWWSLPHYPCPVTAMAIQPHTSNLVAIYSDHKIIEYNITMKQYTEFSNNLQKRISTHWLSRPFPVTNITFDPNNENIIICHDNSTVYVIHKDTELIPDNKPLKLRKHSNGEDENYSENVMKVVKKYKHLVHLEWLSDGEMVAVEVDPISIIEKLPPTLKQKYFHM
ncbi:hypothetical protein PV327_007222 [Microctonus hyperodae]|uniref:Anaphase-promoting complex subunit 4-like WD40 domain-containing protein n=1 Tax=Microctonus hyperodae TaxID=165561 RepID=A0AA39F5Y2_MICHY|nr:hypothetical protein PV327_007222 [Microctonus hyperodae]